MPGCTIRSELVACGVMLNRWHKQAQRTIRSSQTAAAVHRRRAVHAAIHRSSGGVDAVRRSLSNGLPAAGRNLSPCGQGLVPNQRIAVAARRAAVDIRSLFHHGEQCLLLLLCQHSMAFSKVAGKGKCIRHESQTYFVRSQETDSMRVR